ncbi:MAG: hypothetical protein A2583_03145 [Bdellovibrionales bacterium RIFOXYD1_FULL_53_11]|nr:MAG: hypothetical protein A2583_03145 [Bdellovibrionales bacterium RIFOXYD1_FULL_53_11]
MNRYLTQTIRRFSQKKFLFLCGPRQVGKTTSARELLDQTGGMYLNWDIPEDRERILKEVFTSKAGGLRARCLVLDEIHKYPRWKLALKGLFDRKLAGLSVIVTGSARLDVYQKGGDSLLGRYEYLRMHPLSLGELRDFSAKPPPASAGDWRQLGQGSTWNEAEVELRKLETRSGFPEPFADEDPLLYGRWSVLRKSQLIREDIRDLSNIQLFSLLEHMIMLLPERVGSPLSINSLREDVRINHQTASTWLDLLERLYFTFRIPPYSRRIARSITKESKLYFWDWAQNREPGAVFENLVASHLLKSVHLWTDLGYGEHRLCYLRNKDGDEIDFLVLKEQKPVVAIECKVSDESISSSWRAFDHVLRDVPRIQLVRKPGVDFSTAGGIRVVSAGIMLAGLS